MKRFLIIITLTLLFITPGYGQKLLKATVQKEWTVDTARQEAFKNIEPKKDLSSFDEIDPHLIENKMAINKNLSSIGKRIIQTFNDGYYNIRIYDCLNYDKNYVYASSGKLKEIHFKILQDICRYNNLLDTMSLNQALAQLYSMTTYPYKAYTYDYPGGDLSRVIIQVSPTESFSFLSTGELNSHCKDRFCYDINGSILYERNIEF